MPAGLQVIQDVACTRCGCVCDDLQLIVQNNQIVSATGTCSLSHDWFVRPRLTQPTLPECDGASCAHDAALDRAAQLLDAAARPLIFGLARSSTPGVRAAVALAEQLGACIDPASALHTAPGTLALQAVGQSTCTLGEVKDRCDLVIFWGADPLTTHPRHFERYSVEPAGEFLPGGRNDRTVVVIDNQPTASSAVADLFLQLPDEDACETICLLRSFLRETETDDKSSTGEVSRETAALSITDPQRDELRRLAELMRQCRVGIVFFGSGLTRGQLAHRTIEGLFRLVTELNATTRFHVRQLGDASAAEHVLCWQTGYPFAVDFSRGYPRHQPDEFSANALLERGEVDCCLVVGSESLAQLSAAALDRLRQIPTIFVDPAEAPTANSCAKLSMQPDVRFVTSVYGIHLPGTAYRMDDVPIPLRQILPAVDPSDADVLQALCAKVSSLRASPPA